MQDLLPRVESNNHRASSVLPSGRHPSIFGERGKEGAALAFGCPTHFTLSSPCPVVKSATGATVDMVRCAARARRAEQIGPRALPAVAMLAHGKLSPLLGARGKSVHTAVPPWQLWSGQLILSA